MSSNQWELDAIVLGEHVSSVLSLIGECFVIFTFVFTTKFRKPVNRLIFFATWGNIMGNVATFIARGAIDKLNGRVTSPLCNFQGFLEQMFFPADAFFCLCMAINVYLTVILRYPADRLRKLEPYYILLSYGIPFAIAFPLIFISTPQHGPIYGDAILWCWIRPEYDTLRVALFYGPVWVIILASLFLYAWTGAVIFRMRSSLRKFARSYSRGTTGGGGGGGIQLTTVTQVVVQAQGPDDKSAMTNDPYRCEITTGDEYRASQALETPRPVLPVLPPPKQSSNPQVSAARNALKANKAAWAYARCAMLFFIGLQITWIPSTANRLWPYAHDGKPNAYLSIVAAIVLPGQGFWNGVIYAATSWSSCVSLWNDIVSWFGKKKRRDGMRSISSTENIPASAQAVGAGRLPRSTQGIGHAPPDRSRSIASSYEEELKGREMA